VRLVDLAADDAAPPTVSSIVVSAGSGNRAVVSTNAGVRHLALPDLKPVLAGADVVQVDGHYPELARAVLGEARRQGVPTLIDAGSWKPTMPDLVTMLDVVVCSADFRPPGTSTPYEIASFLADRGVRWIAVTHGAGPTLRWTGDGFVEQPVPRTRVVDTLGAGDVFHGALTFAVAQRWPLTDQTFAAALDAAGAVASRSCASFGTRTWMTAPAPG
jgi:sugar/nucleoside kinase (ribokinase family)